MENSNTHYNASAVGREMIMSEFDPLVWQKLSGITPGQRGVSLVVGPVDAFTLTKSRQVLLEEGYQFGAASPTDVFLFSTGEAPDRSQTKVGGLPYLHRHDVWPKGSSGQPLPFVAQMNFRDSKDIVGEKLPGQLLLVFGELPSDDESTDVELLWKNVSTNEGLVQAIDLPCEPSFDPFFGTRWRTETYPHAYTDPRNDWLISNTQMEPIFASEIFATQISRHPFQLSRVTGHEEPQVLCCFAPIVPTTDGPFPFCNEPSPLLDIRGSLDYVYASRYRYVHQWLTWGDSTSLYILQHADGTISHEFIIG